MNSNSFVAKSSWMKAQKSMKKLLKSFSLQCLQKNSVMVQRFSFLAAKRFIGYEWLWEKMEKSRAEIQSESIYLFFMCLWGKQFFVDCRYKTCERGWNENGPGNWNKIAFYKKHVRHASHKNIYFKALNWICYCCVRVVMKAPGKLHKNHLI